MTEKTGFLFIDKPPGMTSHDVVDVLRRMSGIKKIGHAGTLDPFATGLLILAVGREATKRIDSLIKSRKTYEAIIALGATTETLDTEKPELRDEHPPKLAKEMIVEAMQALTGDLLQIPPRYAAIKVKGKKLYEVARKGETIEVEPRPVTVYSFDLLDDVHVDENGITFIKVLIDCSSGTYIRALARDLGAVLHTSGYLRALRRLSIGDIPISDAIPLDTITPENWTDFLHP